MLLTLAFFLASGFMALAGKRKRERPGTAAPSGNPDIFGKITGFVLIALGLAAVAGSIWAAVDGVEGWQAGVVFYVVLGIAFIGAGYNLIRSKR